MTGATAPNLRRQASGNINDLKSKKYTASDNKQDIFAQFKDTSKPSNNHSGSNSMFVMGASSLNQTISMTGGDKGLPKNHKLRK